MSDLPSRDLGERLHQALLAWFAVHARPFPWRRHYQPYQVWVSEIMLQQTQAERGVVYFERWLTRFPDVQAVAAAREEEVLKFWEGLGYYSRARNLQAAARHMVTVLGGDFPSSLPTLLALPGIGPYTARAILSIALEQDHAVVDANVERLFARLFAIDLPLTSTAAKSRIRALAEALLPPGQARHWNQALMELGALVCGRGTPACDRCPLAGDCRSLADGLQNRRPRTGPSRPASLVTSVAAVIADGDLIYVQQRPEGSRWARLWELPGGDLHLGQDDPAQAVVQRVWEDSGLMIRVQQALPLVSHSYTRYRATIHPFLCRLTGAAPSSPLAAGRRWLPMAGLAELAMAAGHRRIIQALAASDGREDG